MDFHFKFRVFSSTYIYRDYFSIKFFYKLCWQSSGKCNFSKKIYGKRLTVEFLKKVRDEKKFENLNALKDQIFKDISTAESYFV